MKRFIIILISILFSTMMCIIPEDLQTTTDGDGINHAPSILNYSPASHVISIELGDSDQPIEIDFFIEAEDRDGDALSYKWEVFNCNDCSCKVKIEPADTSDYKFLASLPERELIIGVEVSDSINKVYHYWILDIARRF